ncbi:MAG: glycosyltransferase family 2 protein [Mesorhizobium sp.]|uniref:glycosyltransferase family A protein n=1 Tax=Mesorhizobium sp. TaxID=1871066 RepID=UPI00122BAC21|nr:glycosyltransferase family A protein [Mesorhizobium sp.]TIL76896.1 MAG: glycosyltransferase family 2 protein [Mesorhizobium sp.]TIL93832.1 MAG: glycosyltransferase family 2 protein [Mesorhizobium sp.]TIM02626.1 MAG: glycosyltransferase family 2 protein [Mesorhizobium sp.]
MHKTIANSPSLNPASVCLASRTIRSLFEESGLDVLLESRGIALDVAGSDTTPHASVVAVLIGLTSDDDSAALRATAGRFDLPIINLGDSWVPGRRRLSEQLPGHARGEDSRLQRLVESFGRMLDADAVAALVGALPQFETDWSPAKGSHVPVVLLGVHPELRPAWALFVEPDRLEALALAHGLSLASDHNAAGSALLVMGDKREAWEALAQGREVICAGACPFTGLGLTHDAPDPTDLPRALASLASGRRNRRDVTRRVLATEALFNSFGGEPAVIAAALDEAVRAVGRQPHRLVSIVITSHNYLAFVGEAIRSALTQTVSAHEVIVVDDGSDDGSAGLIAATSGIIPVLKPNGGQASAFNAGFARATGDVVLFLDADDRLLPEAVARVASADLRGVSRLQFGLETIDAAGRPTGLYSSGRRAASGHLAGTLAAQGIFPFMPTSGNAFPRHVLKTLLPMPEAEWTLWADLYLVLACAVLGETVDLGAVLGQYRVHGGNGHFRMLGGEPYLHEVRLGRQVLAWRALSARLFTMVTRPQAERWRLGLQRRVLSAAFENVRHRRRTGIRDATRESFNALALAASSRTIPRSARAAHALLPARLALGLPGRPKRQPLPGAESADLVDYAGPATWPQLGPGYRLDMTSAQSQSEVLGSGWSHPSADGVYVEASEAVLAFRLPEVAAHWRLRLDFAVTGTGPLRGFEVWLNGTRIEALDLGAMGVIDLRLPGELITVWSRNLPGPGALSACIALRVGADVGRLCISLLRLDLLPLALPPAPRLPAGRFFRILPMWTVPPRAAGESTVDVSSGDTVGSACLGEGWDWPDDQGARLVGQRGQIYLSVAECGDHALTFQLDRDPGGSIPDIVQIVVNEALTAIHEAPDRRSFTAVLSAGAVADGRVRIELSTFEDPVTGAWPDICLAALRIDRLDHAGGGPLLPLNIPLDVSPLANASASTALGLVPDGRVARVIANRFRLTLQLPSISGPARIRLRVVAGVALPGPVAACLSLGDRPLAFWLGRDNAIDLDLPDGVVGAVSLNGRIDAPERLFTLKAVQLWASSPFPPTNVAPLAGNWPPSAEGLGPKAVHSSAVDPAAWHPAVEDALWLAVHRTTLLLPPPPTGTQALDVSVVTIGEPLQRLSLELGSARIETAKPGLQVLRLPLPVAGASLGLSLTVACDGLIAADTVGANGPGMLGGAICRIVAVTDDLPKQVAPHPCRRSVKGSLTIRQPFPLGDE